MNRRILSLGLGLAVLIIGFYVVENYRGAQAWRASQEAYRRAGGTLQLEALFPIAIPDAENYAANALLRDLPLEFDSRGPRLNSRTMVLRLFDMAVLYPPNARVTPPARMKRGKWDSACVTSRSPMC